MRGLDQETTLGLHALHLMFAWRRPVSAREIHASGQAPLGLVRRVLRRLLKAGLIESRPRQGYVPGRSPGEVRVFDVMAVLQAQIAPQAPCEGDFENCASRGACLLSPLCRSAQERFDEALRSFTLADLERAPLGLPNCQDPRLRPEAG